MTTDYSEAITNAQRYINIVKKHAYNLSADNRQKQLSTLRIKQEMWSNEALQFIQESYIRDKYFDELDMLADGGEILTEARLVVNIVFPGYLDNLKKIMEIMLDADNMLALSPSNFVAWKQRALHLNDEQKRLIEHKEQIILNRYKLKMSDVVFYRSKLDSNIAVQRSIDEICRDVENYIKSVQKSVVKAEHSKAVEVYDMDGNKVAVYESSKAAALGMMVNRSEICMIANKKVGRKSCKSKIDGKRYTFCFVGDKPQL